MSSLPKKINGIVIKFKFNRVNTNQLTHTAENERYTNQSSLIDIENDQITEKTRSLIQAVLNI